MASPAGSRTGGKYEDLAIQEGFQGLDSHEASENLDIQEYSERGGGIEENDQNVNEDQKFFD